MIANYYLGGVDHKLQLGAGAVLLHQSSDLGSDLYAAATLVIGYRYIPHDGGFNFGAAFTPFLGTGGFFPYFLPWGGVSVGGGF